jgi:hypothetical protein
MLGAWHNRSNARPINCYTQYDFDPKSQPTATSPGVTRHEIRGAGAGRFGVLSDPAFPGIPSVITDLQVAARTLGLQLLVVNARTDGDLETAFATFSLQRVGTVARAGGLMS